MEKIKIFTGKIKGIAPLLTVGLTCLLGFMALNKGHHLQRASTLSGGLQTCFSRLGQTYTANIIGDKTSPYLKKDFFVLTEECVSELISQSSKEAALFKSFNKQANTLNSEIHWFHNNVSNQEIGSKFTSGKAAEINGRFEKIEMLKDEAGKQLEQVKRDEHEGLKKLGFMFYVLAGLSLLSVLIELTKRWKLQRINSYNEKTALKEIQTSAYVGSAKIQSVIKRALESNKLHHCAELFSSYHEDFVKGIELERIKKSDGLLQVQFERANALFESDSEENTGIFVEGKEEAKLENTEDIAICNLLTDVIKVLSPEFFKHGVVLDLNLEDNKAKVEGDREAYQQVLYSALNYSLRSCHETIGKKIVRIDQKMLGPSIVIDIEDSGQGFSEEVIKHELGLIEQAETPVDLMVIKELLGNLKGELRLENLLEEGRVVGGKIKIFMRGKVGVDEKKSSKRLISLKRAKKRDLLKDLA